MSDPLASLLVRIQSKIEGRTRRPWFDLQRTYYYKDSNAVRTVEELRLALEHFHVLLSQAELNQLFDSFPHPSGNGFDFKSFAERCYPRERLVGRIVDGRTIGDFSPNGTQAAASSSSSSAAATQSFQQQQQAAFEQQQQQEFERQYQAQQQAAYEAEQQQLQFEFQQQQQQQQYVPLNQTFQGPNGVSYYHQPVSQTAIQGTRSLKSTTSRNGTSRAFKPRLTYNRPHHARWNEVPFENSFPRPSPASYPHQELASKPRFAEKPPVVLVDVPRRHNISRQYNRDGKILSPKKK